MQDNHIILVNENDEATGTMDKLEVHEKGILHRAFSIFVLNSNHEMLLHKRSGKKYHTPGLWTNACCSHPFPGENYMDAAHRRLMEELGFDCELVKLFDFIYHAQLGNGLIEHEFDHVLLGVYDGEVQFNSNEISAYKFLQLSAIEDLLECEELTFTPWFQIAFKDVACRIRNKKITNSI